MNHSRCRGSTRKCRPNWKELSARPWIKTAACATSMQAKSAATCSVCGGTADPTGFRRRSLLFLTNQSGGRQTLIALIAPSCLAALVPVGIRYLHRGSKFYEKDTIVVADFDNRTGESGWDATLKLALTNDLENSKYLNVLPDQTVSETLKMMRHQPDEHLTKDLATQVCLRNGNKALLTASIAKVGERYHLDLRAINCVTGTIAGKRRC